MMDPQALARLVERVRRLYLPHDGLPLFCEACNVDADTGLCNGCLRSLQEITNWPDLSHEDRHAVWNQIIATRLTAAREAERAERQGRGRRRSLPAVEPASETQALQAPEISPPPDRVADLVSGRAPATEEVAPAEAAPAVASESGQGEPPVVAAVPAPVASAATQADQAAAPGTPALQLASAEETADALAMREGMHKDMGEVRPQAVVAQLGEPPTPETVPVDVAAARAAQVRAEMLRVVQAALARERLEATRESSGPDEIKLKPLV